MGFGRGMIIVVLALLANGCAGYRLGPTDGLQAGVRTIFVVPFSNITLEPRLGDPATFALRKEIQRDGTFRLVGSPDADLVVTSQIIQYRRDELSFLPSDVITAVDYRISMTAHVVARDRVSGKVVLDRDVTGNTLMFVGDDLPSAERQSMPLAATDLARKITSLLADGGW
jgi:hypothetical protein